MGKYRNHHSPIYSSKEHEELHALSEYGSLVLLAMYRTVQRGSHTGDYMIWDMYPAEKKQLKLGFEIASLTRSYQLPA